jgi:hypothetical protein
MVSAWATPQIRAAICTAEPKRSLLSSMGSPDLASEMLAGLHMMALSELF